MRHLSLPSFLLGNLLLATTAPLTAAEEAITPPSATTTPPEALVTVNGRTVTRDMFAAYYQLKLQSQPVDISGRTQQLALLNELINYLLLEQDAVTRGLDRRPAVAAQLEIARSQMLASVAIDEYLSTHKPPEAELKRAYDKQFKNKSLAEYRVSHILLESRADAQEVIKALKAGETFEALAKKRSSDTSAASGGGLGWLSAEQMDPALQTALEKMAEGEFSQEPVKSEFGWHVLRLEQMRNIPQPSYAEMRDTLRQQQQKQQLASYIRGLREQAKLDVNVLQKGQPVPQQSSD